MILVSTAAAIASMYLRNVSDGCEEKCNDLANEIRQSVTALKLEAEDWRTSSLKETIARLEELANRLAGQHK